MNAKEPEITPLEKLTTETRRSLLPIYPPEMIERAQWVCWRFVQRDGEAKPTKVPVAPLTGGPASTTDPSTWGTYLDVNRYYGKDRSIAGFGFVFTDDDPYVGIDLDNAVDDAGNLTPFAADIVNRLNSYTEISVSGKGLHIIVKGALPEDRGRKNTKTGVEVYSRARFFIMTGRHVTGTPKTVEDRQAVLDTLLPELFPQQASVPSVPTPPGAGNSLADDTLVERACNAANGLKFRLLWAGQWQEAGYASQSEADLAFCGHLAFWTNRDPERIDRIFRRSGLMRLKWDRNDYRKRVIDLAMQRVDGYAGDTVMADNPFTRRLTLSEIWPEGAAVPAAAPSQAVVPASDTPGAVPPDIATPVLAPVPVTVPVPEPLPITPSVSGTPMSVPEPATASAPPAAIPTPENLLNMSPAQLEAVKLATLVQRYGPAYTLTKNGLTINQPYLAAKFRLDHPILYEPQVGEFYAYDQARGLWTQETEAVIKTRMADDIKKMADVVGVDALTMRRSDSFLTGLVKLLRGYAEERDPFANRGRVIHLQNGMIDLADAPPVLMPFSPEYRSRNQSPIAYDAQARCPRFLGQLLGPVLSPDDIDLLQRWAGMALLGRNLAQRLLILTGPGGAGKGTFANVMEHVLGLENVAQLRTTFLNERFELYGFLDRSLLAGKDVPGNFLNDRGAHVIKALVGNDLLDAEKKGGNRFQIRGNFNVLIATNTRLRVKLDGDTDAWRRRLLIVEYKPRPTTVKTVPGLDLWLLRDEAAGILNWMIQGAAKLLRELDQVGDFVLTPSQLGRIDSLLSESDSLREFVRKCVIPCEHGDVTVDELTKGYTAFCESRGWDPLPVRLVENQLRDVMLELHHAAKRNDIKRGGKSVKGFGHVQLTMEGADA